MLTRLLGPVASFLCRHWTFTWCRRMVFYSMLPCTVVASVLTGVTLAMVINIVLRWYMSDYFDALDQGQALLWIAQHPLLFAILYIYSIPFALFDHGGAVWRAIAAVDCYFVLTWLVVPRLTQLFAVRLYNLATPWCVWSVERLINADRSLRRLNRLWFEIRFLASWIIWRHAGKVIVRWFIPLLSTCLTPVVWFVFNYTVAVVWALLSIGMGLFPLPPKGRFRSLHLH